MPLGIGGGARDRPLNDRWASEGLICAISRRRGGRGEPLDHGSGSVGAKGLPGDQVTLFIEHSMSRRGNRHDNAVAESFISSRKRERIRRRTYKTRE